MALMNALLITAIMTMMLVAGTNFVRSSAKVGRSTQFDQQAFNVARAGLVDAINWFKREPLQPVTKFRPAYNPTNPLRGATLDPSSIDPGNAGGKLHRSDSGGGNNDKPHLGIVQEFPLDEAAGLYARYEVGKVTRYVKGAPGQAARLDVMERDGSGDWVQRTLDQARSDEWEGVEDVTGHYGLGGEGLVWSIRSHGYVYKRDPNAPAGTRFYQYPNEVLGDVELETEIYRLQVKDHLAAIHGLRGDQMTFSGMPKVNIKATGGYAVMFNTGTGQPNPAATPATFTATYREYESAAPAHSLGWPEMFGVANGNVLASLSDVYVTDISQLPTTMSTMALTYIKGDAVFTAMRPLKGGGILAVDGNLTLGVDSASSFTGLIYVTGNYTQHSPSLVTGAVVARGTVNVTATGTEDCFIEYNQELLNEVRRQLGQYRERRTAGRVTP